MSRKRCTLRIDADLLERLQSVAERTGMSQSEQIRQGIRWWLESREWPLKSNRVGSSGAADPVRASASRRPRSVRKR